MSRTRENAPRILLALAALLFVGACATTALHIGRVSGSAPTFPMGSKLGIELLALGWGLIDQNPAWLANPLLLTASLLILMKRWRYAALVSVAAAMLAASLFRLNEFRQSGWHGSYTSQVMDYGPGAYLWLASVAVTVAASAVGLKLAQNANPTGKRGDKA